VGIVLLLIIFLNNFIHKNVILLVSIKKIRIYVILLQYEVQNI